MGIIGCPIGIAPLIPIIICIICIIIWGCVIWGAICGWGGESGLGAGDSTSDSAAASSGFFVFGIVHLRFANRRLSLNQALREWIRLVPQWE
jgi:hypothetical protein